MGSSSLRSRMTKLFKIFNNEVVLYVIQKSRGLFSSKIKRELINSSIGRFLGSKKVENNFNDTPIIIGGCGRSGTTLLLTILGAHPHIYPFPGETGAFLNWDSGGKNEVAVPHLSGLYSYILTSKIPTKSTRWCEKTPMNVRYFDKILDYFKKNVKIIHIVRDGRDVMLSRHPSDPESYWVNPDRWVNDVQAGLKFIDHPQVLTIKYEDLILSYEKTLSKICNFINEKFTGELKDWFKNSNLGGSPVQEHAWGKSISQNQKLHTKSIGKWKKAKYKERVSKIMKNKEVVKLLKKLDYL